MEEWNKIEDNLDIELQRWKKKPLNGRLFEYKLGHHVDDFSTCCNPNELSWVILGDGFDIVAWRYVEETIPEMRVRQILFENGHTVSSKVIYQIAKALTA